MKGQFLVTFENIVTEPAGLGPAVKLLAGKHPSGDIFRFGEIGIVEQLFRQFEEFEKFLDETLIAEKDVDADQIETDPFLQDKGILFNFVLQI